MLPTLFDVDQRGELRLELAQHLEPVCPLALGLVGMVTDDVAATPLTVTDDDLLERTGDGARGA